MVSLTTTESSEGNLLEATKQKLSTLHVQRQALEAEGEAIISELTTPPAPGVKPAGIDDPLVDHEGYPRGDIDVYRARTLRGRLAEIRTDRRSIMDESERLLHQLAALQNPNKAAAEQAELAARAAPKPKPKYDPATGRWVVRNWDGTVSGSGASNDDRSFDSLGAAMSSTAATKESMGQESSSAAPPTSLNSSLSPAVSLDETFRSVKPFAKVDSVAENSPASSAGLRVDDLLLRFGTAQIDGTNYEDAGSVMSFVGQAVPQLAAQGSSVRVVVRRTNAHGEVSTVVELTLTPRPWAGRGLLGCHILPYKE